MTATKDEGNRTAMMTADRHVEIHIHLPNAETKTTSWSIADMNHVVN